MILPANLCTALILALLHKPFCSKLFINRDALILSDTIRDGEFRRFSKKGVLLEKSMYYNGLKHGYSILYYDNQKEYAELYYDRGKLNGTCKWYEYSGKLYKEISYSNGLLNGSWISYVKGRKNIQAEFNGGKLNGWYYDFYKNGSIQHRAYYSNGIITTSESYFNKNKILVYQLICDHSDSVKNHLKFKTMYNASGEVIGRRPIDLMPMAYYIFGIEAF